MPFAFAAFPLAARLGQIRCIYCDALIPWAWAKTRDTGMMRRCARSVCEECADRIAAEPKPRFF